MTMSEHAVETTPGDNGHKGAIRETSQPSAMARWDPTDFFESIQDEMDRFWRRLGPQLPMTPRFRFRGVTRGAWAPRIDIYDRDNELVIKADLPGMKKEDVQLELGDGVLVIRGETEGENETRGDQYYRVERSYGSFYRRIPLPFDIDADRTTATMNDGVLEIRISRPPSTGQEPHKITIA
jgi:HSP20 family protein